MTDAIECFSTEYCIENKICRKLKENECSDDVFKWLNRNSEKCVYCKNNECSEQGKCINQISGEILRCQNSDGICQ